MALQNKLIWINKNAALKHLSRSEGIEKARIFGHVQLAKNKEAQECSVVRPDFQDPSLRHPQETSDNSSDSYSSREANVAQIHSIEKASMHVSIRLAIRPCHETIRTISAPCESRAAEKS